MGSVIYEDSNILTLLWRLESLKSNFISYFPAFVTGRKASFTRKQKKTLLSLTIDSFQPQYRQWEGALDIYLTEEARIYKLVNRPVQESDRLAAAQFAEIKAASKEEAETRDRKLTESALKNMHEN